jgi:hypothetical protein
LVRQRAELGFTDRAAEILISVAAADLLLHQANRRMPAPPGPEEPAVGGENRTIVFQGEREINAIP